MTSKLTKYLILAKTQAFFVDAKTNFHIQSLDYSEELNELDNLISYAKKFADKEKLGVLISDDLVYVFSSKIKFTDELGKAIDEKVLVENKITEKIPEEISDVVWDYKAKQVDSDNKLFQIAVTNPLTTVIVSKLFDSDIDIDFVEPICYALARSIETVKEAHIIVSANLFENCIIISNNKYINLALAFNKENFKEDFSSVLDYVLEVFGQESGGKKIKIYASNDSIKQLNFAIPQGYEEKYELQIANVNIFSKELLDESQHHGKNEDVLNLIPPSKDNKYDFTSFHAPKVNIPHIHVPHVPEISLSAHMPSMPAISSFGILGVLQNKKILISVAIFILIALGTFSAYKYIFANDNNSLPNEDETSNIQPAAVDIQTNEAGVQTQPQDTQTNTTANTNVNDRPSNNVADTSTEPTTLDDSKTTVQYSAYRLIILNGSGIPGEASKLSEAFKKEGFRSPDIGNYPSGTIKQTTVRVKSATPDEVLNKASSLLNSYDISYSSEFLDPTSPYDLEIVVGETRL